MLQINWTEFITLKLANCNLVESNVKIWSELLERTG